MTTCIEASKGGLIRPRRPNLRALTGIRFLAALHVLIQHCCPMLIAAFAAHVAQITSSRGQILKVLGLVIAEAITGFASCGYVSVSLFFVLSGFILAYNYEPEALGQPSGAAKFWFSRFARIYPVYLLAWVLFLPMGVADARKYPIGGLGWSGTAFALGAASLGLVQTWFPPLSLRWNSPAWSLSVEAFCYLMFPLILVRCRRVSLARLKTDRFVWYCIVGLWLFSTSASLCFNLCDAGHRAASEATGGYVAASNWVWSLRYFPLLRLPEFVIGLLMGRLFVADLAQGRRRLKGMALPLMLFAMAVISFSRRLPRDLLSTGFLAPVFAVALYDLAHKGKLARRLSGRVIVLLGESSYSMYILHVPVLILLNHAAAKLWPKIFQGVSPKGLGVVAPSLLYFVGQLTIVVIIAVASFRYIETPARYLLKRMARDPRPVELACAT